MKYPQVTGNEKPELEWMWEGKGGESSRTTTEVGLSNCLRKLWFTVLLPNMLKYNLYECFSLTNNLLLKMSTTRALPCNLRKLYFWGYTLSLILE